MYNVSSAYEVAVTDSRRRSTMRGVLTVGKTVINLDDNDIIKDTVYVTNQSVNGSEFEFGCTYAAECGLTIKSGVNRYKLYDAKLELYWSLDLDTGSEEIPLGVFYIAEANRVNDKISIKALDGMTKLDKTIKDDTQGTLVQLIDLICDKCGVKRAQTDGELGVFVNSDIQYDVEAERIDSYRDLLSYLCSMSACFAVFDRSGRLKLVPYIKENETRLYKRNRFRNATFSDYTTQFSGVKARFIAEENYAPYEVGSEDPGGLVLDMGDIPIVRGLPDTKYEALTNVYNVLRYIEYEPCEIEIPGNPAYDLGDYVVNENVGSDNKVFRSYITYSYWTYRGKHKLKSVGGNPKLANVKSKQDKQVSSAENSIASKSIQVKSYINADKITFKGSDVDIAALNYAATEASNILFLMTVRINVSLDGVLEIAFYTDAAADAERVFRKYLPRGEHFLTISELYVAETNDRHTITVKAHMEYFESDSRKQAADITTSNNFLQALNDTGASVMDNIVVFPTYEKGKIDKTVATATIEKGGVKAILYGQGIATDGKWDGTISISEGFNIFKDFGGANLVGFTGEYGKNVQNPRTGAFTEAFDRFTLVGGMSVGALSETISKDEVIDNYTFNTSFAGSYEYDKYISTSNDIFSLKSIYTTESVEEKIDSGKMCSVSIDYTGLDVESVVVKNG